MPAGGWYGQLGSASFGERASVFLRLFDLVIDSLVREPEGSGDADDEEDMVVLDEKLQNEMRVTDLQSRHML